MSAYSAAVLADAPLHYWRCADPGEHVLHDIGSSPDHLVASPRGAITGWSGPVSDGGAADFTLAGVQCQTGIQHSESGNPMSLECLVWINSLQSAINVCMEYSKGNTLSLVINAANNWQAFYNSIGQAGSAVVRQRWTHLVLTYDGANLRLYVDSNVFGPVGVAGLGGTTGFYSLANSPALSQGILGMLSECAVYTSALSTGRVAAHYGAIDQQSRSPVYGGAGGVIGAGGSQTDPQYLGALQTILQAVQRELSNAP